MKYSQENDYKKHDTVRVTNVLSRKKRGFSEPVLDSRLTRCFPFCNHN